MQFDEYPGRPWKIAPESMSAAQRTLLDRVASGPRKAIPPNIAIWANNIDFAEVAERFGLYVVKEAPYTPRQKEIVILAVAAHYGSAFEQHFHEPLARQHGLTEAEVAAIREGRDPGLANEFEQTSWELANCWLEVQPVSDELHARAMRVLGHKGVSDVVGLMGLYTMIAQTIAFYRVPVPGGPTA